MNFKNLLSTVLALPVFFAGAYAEENETAKPVDPTELNERVNGIDENVSTLLTDVSGLKKMKISGYLQINFEKTEERKSGLGKNPYNSSDVVLSRFRVRRSRVKFNYDAGLTQVVVQGDFSNSGFSLKDAYLEITDPWTKQFSLTSGVFNRPNYEVEYSSSQRESPERSAVVRALYPDERDLGAMISFKDDDLFNIQVAAFNNTFQGGFKQPGIPNFSTEPLYFMGRITKSFSFRDLGLGIDLGAHARFGNVVSSAPYVFESKEAVTKTWAVKDSAALMTHKTGATNATYGRNWFGVEAQIYYDFLAGTKLMGEFITGKDVNELNDTLILSSMPSIAKTNSYVRKRDFSGFYAMLVQSLTPEWQVAVKYDSYNANTAIDEATIASTSELTKSTLGFGIHNYTFSNVRLTLWYDMIKTKTNDRILKTDPIDNFMTVRLQYKF